MLAQEEISEYVTVWVTNDNIKYTHFITNFGRESKWEAVDKLLEVMAKEDVILIRTFKNLSNGETVEGDLLGALKIQLNKSKNHPKPNQEQMLEIIKKHENKVVREDVL